MIYIIENFLNGQEVDLIVSEMEPLLKGSPDPDISRYTKSALGFPNTETARAFNDIDTFLPLTNNQKTNEALLLLQNIYLRLRSTMESQFNIKLGLVQFIFNRMYIGSQNSLHVDDATGMYPELEYSGLIYLSNAGQDFMGGDIVFPKQDLRITTTKGMLVFFKGDVEHPHAVEEVLSGYRDNIITFFEAK